MRPPCTGVTLDTVKSWIGTGTASPASSSKARRGLPSRAVVMRKFPPLHVRRSQRPGVAHNAHWLGAAPWDPV